MSQSMNNAPRRSGEGHQPSGVTNKVHPKTTTQGQRVVHQQIGDNVNQKTVSNHTGDNTKNNSPVKSGNKGQKQRDGSRRKDSDQPDAGQNIAQTQNNVRKPSSSKGQQQQRQSYKILSTNEI